jgi:pimeloyl-ACP methyl ester carboxylesterase
LLLLACAALGVNACSRNPTPNIASARVPFMSDRISVTTRGPENGQDIILVHGLAAHPDVWSAVADSLGNRYRLHLVGISGFGGSAPGANATGNVAAPVAEEIARYMRSNGRGATAIVGHSMGGAIAMMVAARHPELVGHLMVIDEPPSLGVVFGPGLTADSLRRMADGMRDAMLNAPGGTLGPFEQMLPTMTRVESARPKLVRYAHESNLPTVANAFHELIVTDLRPELGRISAPTTVLYVVPAALPMSPDVFRQNLQQAFSPIRRLRLVQVDSSAHYIQIDQPGRVVAEIRALMSRSE